MLELKDQWPGFGISPETLEESALRLERHELWARGPVSLYFEAAGRLLRLTRYEFFLLPFVFVQAVIGLEKLLRFYFKDDAREMKLSDMLKRAVSEQTLTDAVFADVSPLDSARLKGLRYLTDLKEAKSLIIPRMRNDIVHGDYRLTPEFLPLTLQVRLMAEQVGAKCVP